MSARLLNVGLIGGGGGAFIVQPHQRAVHFDGTRRVVSAALHPDPKIAMSEAANWPYPIKGYENYDDLIAAQKKLPKEERIDYALICTPNFVHYDPAIKCLKAGIPVLCEKPLSLNMKEAVALANAVKKLKVPFAVAHGYIAHWTSRFSRFIVTSGLLGKVRWVDSYYLQGWLAGLTEKQGVMQAEWRVDPKRAGISCCGGDIGTHALMQLRYVTGLEVVATRGFLETFVKGRALDDHFTTYNELSNGGKAIVRASQIYIGHKNDLGIEVVCEKGTLVWSQEDAEKVTIYLPGQPERVYWRREVQPNDGFLKDLPADLMAEPTIPSGHVEGFHDAFARMHRCFEADVRAYNEGKPGKADGSKYANVEDGRIGMAFIAAAVKSSNAGGKTVRWK
jgi:predicted dehydrogenase